MTPSATATYVLTASNAAGSTQASATVTVVSAPIGPYLTTGFSSLQSALATQGTDDWLTFATAFDNAARGAAADPTATEGQRNQAYFFGAVARLVLLANPYSSNPPGSLNRIGDLLDAYGLGGTPAQRSRIDTIQYLDCTSGKCTLKSLSPASPRTAAIQGFLSSKSIPELQEAASRFARVSQTFQGQVTHGTRRVLFDYTDARFLKGAAEAIIAAIRVQEAYVLDVDPVATQAHPAVSADAYLAGYPSLLTLQGSTPLVAARAQAVAAVQSLKEALASLKSETGDQTDHFIKLTSTECTYNVYIYQCRTVFNDPAKVSDAETALNETAAALAATGPYLFKLGQQSATFVPDAFFAGVNLRAKLPPSVYVGAPMPDPTIGGVLVSPTLPQFPAIDLVPWWRWF